MTKANATMAEIAGELREGFLALAVGACLPVMTALMEAEGTGLTRVKGKHEQLRADFDLPAPVGISASARWAGLAQTAIPRTRSTDRLRQS